FVVDNDGGLKRCGGQGDILSGLVGTFLSWGASYKNKLWEHDDSILLSDIPLLASYASCSIVRECSKIAFEKFGRSTQTSDFLEEIESDFDPDKGSFKQFLCYLPKQNRDILVELFDICAQVTAESHINNMPVERLVKTLALCILGDKDKPLEGFEGAYNEWTKCSQACLHLFLAYLREKAVSTELNPRLTILIDNYVEDRKKSVTSV
ncbi:10237_t:CDS:2, partial [Entrophospora sp. SA101]